MSESVSRLCGLHFGENASNSVDATLLITRRDRGARRKKKETNKNQLREKLLVSSTKCFLKSRIQGRFVRGAMQFIARTLL